MTNSWSLCNNLVLTMQWYVWTTCTDSAAAHPTYCALFDKSTKFGTDVFGYGGDQKIQLRLP